MFCSLRTIKCRGLMLVAVATAFVAVRTESVLASCGDYVIVGSAKRNLPVNGAHGRTNMPPCKGWECSRRHETPTPNSVTPPRTDKQSAAYTIGVADDDAAPGSAPSAAEFPFPNFNLVFELFRPPRQI